MLKRLYNWLNLSTDKNIMSFFNKFVSLNKSKKRKKAFGDFLFLSVYSKLPKIETKLSRKIKQVSCKVGTIFLQQTRPKNKQAR
jgi:hypothetical protein